MSRNYSSVQEDDTHEACTDACVTNSKFAGGMELETNEEKSTITPEIIASSDIPPHIQKSQQLIYVSHFVSQFSECAWQFAVILFLAAAAEYNSIFLVSSYYLTTYAAVMFLGAPVGAFLDRTNRLKAAQICIGVENGSILLATVACCWFLIKVKDSHQHHLSDGKQQEDDIDTTIPHDTLSIVLIIAIHVFGSLAMVLNQGFVVAIERDWIVVLSQQTSDPPASLSRTNVILRQIYLACKVLSPTFAGWVVGDASSESKDEGRFCNLHNAAVLVGVLCVTSLLVEYFCTVEVYHLVPELALSPEVAVVVGGSATRESSCEVKPGRSSLANSDNECHPKEEEQEEQEADEKWSDEVSVSTGTGTPLLPSIWRSFVLYWEQPIVWAGLSFAFLNSNALCFGGAMTTFLLWKGMPVTEVGLWRGISSAVGLAGTFAYKLSAQHTSVVNTGGWSIIYLFLCLTLACSSFFVHDYQISIYLLVVSTAMSRIGLWVFDISVTLLYQEMVPDGIRGLIGGTQQSINSGFTMASGCLGLILSKPEQFFWIALAGYVCIGISMVLYMFGVLCRGQQPFMPLR